MKRCILVMILVLFLPVIVYAGSLKIDRVWTSGDYGYALVTYKNDSELTYRSGVTVQCVALDKKGGKIGMNTRSFFVFEHGPIRPGFEGTLKIPVELHGVTMQSMSCKCWGR